ncbi:MAG: hypothetical protein IJD21_01030 [Oscillospiraceae bacterium]|nr:hypothetical protein [Oscillospiraceae bacterium]
MKPFIQQEETEPEETKPEETEPEQTEPEQTEPDQPQPDQPQPDQPDQPEDPKAPSTGDNAPLGVYLALQGLCLGAIVLLLVTGRSRKPQGRRVKK